jgi:hypothetical protein
MFRRVCLCIYQGIIKYQGCCVHVWLILLRVFVYALAREYSAFKVAMHECFRVQMFNSLMAWACIVCFYTSCVFTFSCVFSIRHCPQCASLVAIQRRRRYFRHSTADGWMAKRTGVRNWGRVCVRMGARVCGCGSVPDPHRHVHERKLTNTFVAPADPPPLPPSPLPLIPRLLLSLRWGHLLRRLRSPSIRLPGNPLVSASVRLRRFHWLASRLCRASSTTTASDRARSLSSPCLNPKP